MKQYEKTGQKTGYLETPYQIFCLKDYNQKIFEPHYHDFHKILIFISGNASYFIEGKTYVLNPFDIVLVSAGDIHRPVIHDASCYERIILYLSKSFFESKYYQILVNCFSAGSRIIHTDERKNPLLMESMLYLQKTKNNEDIYSSLHNQVHIIDFLIHLNQHVLQLPEMIDNAFISNPKILDIISYINEHITEDISIDNIASALYINRSYMMHLFKSETGYSIMKYIERKRLYTANSLISSGISKTEACYKCGFKNYSAYYHANRKYNQSTDFLPG